ncbi:hypothetical protein [Gilvimarinus xylanilyticus]|uniref:Uncharacterized protein n=1 Tax=Gilvimarinus xylanilyticus TaxID=2944139 RepID=A0A9X2KTZ3_9GAMM|nr:hypothetical protein [Gilvimarinus xylanilyticus]MCP8900371.1 hypothetical protein [Gilvimarinus xylanilyticus]
MKRIVGYALFFVLGVFCTYPYNAYWDAREHAALDISSISEVLVYQSLLMETYTKHCDIEGYDRWRDFFESSIETYNFRLDRGESFPFVDSPMYFDEHRKRSENYSNALIDFDENVENCQQEFNK